MPVISFYNGSKVKSGMTMYKGCMKNLSGQAETNNCGMDQPAQIKGYYSGIQNFLSHFQNHPR